MNFHFVFQSAIKNVKIMALIMIWKITIRWKITIIKKKKEIIKFFLSPTEEMLYHRNSQNERWKILFKQIKL